MRASTASANGWRCPACGDVTSRDEAGLGYVRHSKNRECDYERGQKDIAAALRTAVPRSAAQTDQVARTFPSEAGERIQFIVEQSVGSSRFMPPTEVFNEGWMLRLVLDWFSRHPEADHPLGVPSNARWYSEALLESRFAARFRGDKLAESHTHADGVIGQFRIGNSGEGDLMLDAKASHFVVAEAKLSSKLSSGTTNASGFDQAARNLACMAHAMSAASVSPEDMTRLGFYVVAPACQIDRGVFSRELERSSLEKKVCERVAIYADESKDAWCDEWFIPVLTAASVQAVTWESVVAYITSVNSEDGRWLGEFYDHCMFFNRLH